MRVWEPGNRRFSLLSAAGEFVKIFALPPDFTRVLKVRILPDGRIAILAVRDDFADKENSQVGAILIHSPDPGTWKTAYERRIKIWNRIDKPAFRDLAADDEGTIWVEPYLENRAEEGKVFDAVLPDGSFIRGVRITGGGAFLRYERSSSIIGKTFWRIETGEDGFSKLVRYKSGA